MVPDSGTIAQTPSTEEATLRTDKEGLSHTERSAAREHPALTALRGEDSGLIVGISWLPPGFHERREGAGGPAESLTLVAQTLDLDFAFVPAEERWAPEAVHRLRDEGIASLWAVPGVLCRVGDRLGWAEMLRLTAAEPGELAAPLAEALHATLQSCREGISAGVDVVLLADDLAGAVGPLVSPDYVLDALMPCYRAVAAEVLGRGVAVAFHSDGDVRALMPSLARAGYSAIHLAGIASDALAASIDAASASGLVAIGGVAGAALGDDPATAGSAAGLLARERGLLVCDDGGIATPDDLTGYSLAVEAAREAYAQEPSRD